jgi:hypothetical protein
MFDSPLAIPFFQEGVARMVKRLYLLAKVVALDGRRTTCIAARPHMDLMHVYIVRKGGKMVNCIRSSWGRAS